MEPWGREEEWIPVAPHGAHPLHRLIDRGIGNLLVRLYEGPRSRFGARYFQVHLQDPAEGICRDASFLVLVGSGRRPSENWIEIAAVSFTAAFSTRRRLSVHPDRSAPGRCLWQLLGESIVPGGHLMVEYESAEWQETERGLARGIPPVATPLGSLLFRIGCGVNFKDWYFSEGLHEGPRKLQGWKAVDAAHQRRRAREMAGDLRSFVVSPQSSELGHRAVRRAHAVLAKLAREGQQEVA